MIVLPDLSLEPEEVVATGAAVYAGMLAGLVAEGLEHNQGGFLQTLHGEVQLARIVYVMVGNHNPLRIKGFLGVDQHLTRHVSQVSQQGFPFTG